MSRRSKGTGACLSSLLCVVHGELLFIMYPHSSCAVKHLEMSVRVGNVRDVWLCPGLK